MYNSVNTKSGTV